MSIIHDFLETEYIAPQLRSMAVEVKSVISDPENAREHDEANRLHVRALLEEFGQLLPIIVSQRTNVVLKGNCTLEQTIALRRTHIAALFVDLDALDAASFALRDNRAGELGSWNGERVKQLVAQLDEAERPRDVLGWSPETLAHILSQAVPVSAPVSTSFINDLLTTAEPRKFDEQLEAETGIRKTLAPEDDAKNAKPIRATPAQRETIDRAIEHMREETEDPHLSEGRALELALGDWLAGI